MKLTIVLHTQRKAIAMIELIFAIVIMGIALLSIPNLIAISGSSSFISLQQEAIASASSQLSMLSTKPWDENNAIEGIILQVSNGDGSLTARNGRRDRTFNLAAGGTLNASPIGGDINDTFDDIDDANGMTTTLRNFSDTDISSGDNIDTNITIATTVDYIDDSANAAYNTSDTIQYNIKAPLAPTTNIKLVYITLTTNNPAVELDKEISLRAFTCNIGSYEPARSLK